MIKVVPVGLKGRSRQELIPIGGDDPIGVAVRSKLWEPDLTNSAYCGCVKVQNARHIGVALRSNCGGCAMWL
jgi:hypothetical protein